MSIEIIPINGKTDFFDYEASEKSVKATLGKRCSDAKIYLLNNFPASVSVETNMTPSKPEPTTELRIQQPKVDRI